MLLSNIPSSFYGYQYRCIVDGNNNNNIFSLKITTSWTGSAGTAWENPANWSCGSLPDGNTDVIIQQGVTNFPEVNTTGICRSLTAKPGVNVTVKTGASFIITH